MKNASPSQPSVLLSSLTVLLLVAVWTYVRLFLFSDAVLPLSFVIPMLVCVWTRRHWQLWIMTTAFATMALAKTFLVLPANALTGWESVCYLGATLANILIGALIVRAILSFRTRIDERRAHILAQNAELEAQSEELSQQNEEIKSQSEELAQQNEEIESQAEELGRQNEELQESNERLSSREEMLQSLLNSSRTPESGQQALADVCRRALDILGEPVASIGILNLAGDSLTCDAQAAVDESVKLPGQWPLAGSLARMVLQENKTAYVYDLTQEPTFAAPFGTASEMRSLLSTPLRIDGVQGGVLVACSHRAAHWSQEQFCMIEWLAAQCGLIMEGLRWQKALTDRAQEVEAANRAKDQFLAMLSHELRTPLTPVLAAAGILEGDERIPSDARDDLKMIRRNVAIQSRLIDDLLDLTRIERGKLDINAERLNVATLLRETATIVAPDLDAKDQTLAMQLELPDGCSIVGDGARLQQVFWNLLKNAIKFSPVKEVISVTAEVIAAEQPRIKITVTDCGTGISQQDLKRIFLPFHQADNGPRHASGSGLGLGLSIAKAIVELHAGSIQSYSAGKNKGAQFTVELPLAEESPTVAPAGSAAPGRAVPESAVQRTLQILLVEDHADTGRIMTRLLKSAGHCVEYAADTATALSLFQKDKFDLVVSDLGLPDESGLIMMQKLRAIQPDLQGICMSGYGMEDDLNDCKLAGFSEHITKPVDLQQLHAAIGRVVSRAAVS